MSFQCLTCRGRGYIQRELGARGQPTMRPVSKARAWQRKVKLDLAPWVSHPGIAAARSECNIGSSEVFSVPIILYLPGLGVAQTILLPSLTVDWSLRLGCLHKGSSFPASCHRLHQLQSAAGQTSLWADTAASWQTRLWSRISSQHLDHGHPLRSAAPVWRRFLSCCRNRCVQKGAGLALVGDIPRLAYLALLQL